MNLALQPNQPPRYGPLGITGAAVQSDYESLREGWNLSPMIAAIALRSRVHIGLDTPASKIDYHPLVALLGEAVRDATPFGRWVFDQGASLLASVKPDPSVIDNNEWTHAVLYLFRAACFTPQPGRSLLDHSESHHVATDLIQKAVVWSELSSSVGTLPVMLKGMVASNIRAWGQLQDISSFYFRPPCVQSPRFVELLADVVEAENAELSSRPAHPDAGPIISPCAVVLEFCKARTPAEFLSWAFEHRAALPAREIAYSLAPLLSARDSTLSCLRLPPSAERNAANTTASFSSHISPLSVAEGQLRRGIYVDVFGTLIGDDHQPNLRLVQIVRDLMDGHRTVYLVSDSSPEDLRRVLGPLSDRLPAVVPKDSLQGSELELLIDNNDPEAQGLRARRFLSPQQAVCLGRRLVDDALCMAG